MHDGKYKEENFMYVNLNNWNGKYNPNMIEMELDDERTFQLILSTSMSTFSIVSSECKDCD